MKRLVVLLILTAGMLLSGCSSTKEVSKSDESWQESATFKRVFDSNGEEDEFVFRIGENGKLGFAEYGPFIAGENKSICGFFGEMKVNL